MKVLTAKHNSNGWYVEGQHDVNRSEKIQVDRPPGGPMDKRVHLWPKDTTRSAHPTCMCAVVLTKHYCGGAPDGPLDIVATAPHGTYYLATHDPRPNPGGGDVTEDPGTLRVGSGPGRGGDDGGNGHGGDGGSDQHHQHK